MSLNNIRFNLKVFLIDKNYFSLKGKSNHDIVEFIRENHKKGLQAENSDFNIVKPDLKNHTEDDFNFYSYCYNQPKSQNYWKLFLPDELGDDQNFEIVEFSFVLFIKHCSKKWLV